MIIFLHIPKTAGSTFQFILEKNFGLFHCHTNHASQHDYKSHAGRKPFGQSELEFARKIFPVLRSLAGHNLTAPLSLQAPQPFHMTFLREPVARVLSQYQERTLINRAGGRPTPGFEEALQTDGELQNLHVKLMGGGENLDEAKRYLERCDFVGLTEKFDLSLQVFEKLYPGKINLRYRKMRVAPDDSIKNAIKKDARLMALAREYNRLDVELYDFAVKEIFPRLCARAGSRPEDQAASLADESLAFTPGLLAGRFYNQTIYRQLCKLRNRHAVA